MKRCEWCLKEEIYKQYHDEEWGVPKYDDRELFEMLILEGVQAGLSWNTVLKKRENYRNAYDNFDPYLIAEYNQRKIDELLSNPGIIRNKLKIEASISNARCYINVVEKNSSFSEYIWRFVDGKQITNYFKSLNEVPATTTLSEMMSRELKKDGFRFVGSTITYAFMQSIGMVNDHITGCFRHKQIIKKYSN